MTEGAAPHRIEPIALDLPPKIRTTDNLRQWASNARMKPTSVKSPLFPGEFSNDNPGAN
jgi:hypothetical protein